MDAKLKEKVDFLMALAGNLRFLLPSPFSLLSLAKAVILVNYCKI